MTWTYAGNPFNPADEIQTPQDNIDSVRFLIQDTDPSDPQLQDGEINGLINNSTGNNNPTIDVYQAALLACIVLSARYARRANKTVGDLSIQASTISKSYRDLYDTIQIQALRHSVPVPYSGGLSLGDMETDQDDDDLNGPWFSRGMDDNPDNAPDFNQTGGFEQVVPG